MIFTSSVIKFVIVAVAAAGLLAVAVPVTIGIFVYRDSKKRGMNAPLWTLITVVAPLYVGLIVYLIVRNDHRGLVCPSCGAPVREEYRICPMCGGALKAKCPGCGADTEPEWHSCPSCGTDLPDNGSAAPRKKNGGLTAVLCIIIIIPLLICGIAAGSFFMLANNANIELHTGSDSSIKIYNESVHDLASVSVTYYADGSVYSTDGCASADGGRIGTGSITVLEIPERFDEMRGKKYISVELYDTDGALIDSTEIPLRGDDCDVSLTINQPASGGVKFNVSIDD